MAWSKGTSKLHRTLAAEWIFVDVDRGKEGGPVAWTAGTGQQQRSAPAAESARVLRCDHEIVVSFCVRLLRRSGVFV